MKTPMEKYGWTLVSTGETLYTCEDSGFVDMSNKGYSGEMWTKGEWIVALFRDQARGCMHEFIFGNTVVGLDAFRKDFEKMNSEESA